MAWSSKRVLSCACAVGALTADAVRHDCNSSLSLGACGPAEKGYKENGGPNSWSLSAGELELTISRSGTGLLWSEASWAGGADCADSLQLGPLFAARLKDGGKLISSATCRLEGPPELKHGNAAISAQLRCLDDVAVAWTANVEQLADGLGAALRTQVSITGARVDAIATALVRDGECVAAKPAGVVDGSPVTLGERRFILAAEHPLAKNLLGASADTWAQAAEATGFAVVAEVSHLSALSHEASVPYVYGSVLVAVAEPATQWRRAFNDYLRLARPSGAWSGPLVHFNSWYDFTSWQDEGFFGAQPALIQELRKEPMCEQGALERVDAFGKFVETYDAKIDSFLWDDGWDDPHQLWEFDRKKFAHGFTVVAEHASKFNAGLGVWLSPWGGYGAAKDKRIELGRQQGYEISNDMFSLAGPKYAARFKEAVLRFRRESKINIFKFDGVNNDPRQVAPEFEAMLQIMSALRKEMPSRKGCSSSGDSGKASESSDSGDENADSFWINLTTGTWPSPFFMLWVDSIWRGNTDTTVPNWPSLQGLTKRQRWQVWRECVVHENIVRRAPLFPVSRLMVHGAVLAGHGDALYNGLSEFNELDWAQEVWSLAAIGLQLQELYVSYKRMNPTSWGELAHALRWARENSEILEDSHWAIPQERSDGTVPSVCQQGSDATVGMDSFLPYVIASYKNGRGFLFLRNPRNNAQLTPPFTLSEALQMRQKDAKATLVASLVRKVSGAEMHKDARLHCDSFGGGHARPVSKGSCSVPADAMLEISMSAGEVLILQVELPEDGSASDAAQDAASDLGV